MESKRFHNNPRIYWAIQCLLLGPLLLLWAGVAYWFGFGSETILRTVVSPAIGPISPLVLLVVALVWTLRHLRKTPAERQIRFSLDHLICLLILFSMFILAGQVMAR